MRAYRAVKNVKFHKDSIELGRVQFQSYLLRDPANRGQCPNVAQFMRTTHLHGHLDISWFVENLFNGTIVPTTEFLLEIELVHVNGK